MANFARKPVFFIFFSLFFLTAVPHVFGAGGRDADLTRADELIKNKQHDEAILILADFAKRNPDRFDQAQQRLRKIFKIRDEFNRTADELIKTITDDPGNNAKIVALSNRLNELEREDSPLLVNFVSRTREIAQFNLNRNLLRSILERGRALLDKGDAAAAIQVYAESMVIMRSEFFAANYGENIDNDVRRETERVNAALQAFQQAGAQLNAVSAEMVRAVNAGDTARINEITARITPAMDRFIALKQSLYAVLNTFDRVLGVIRAREPEMIDRNHLSFFIYGIRGRTEEAIQEGMLGAFQTQWNNTIGNVVKIIAQVIEKDNAAALAAFKTGNYAAVTTSLARTESYINLTPLYFNKRRELSDPAKPQTINLYGSVVLNEDIGNYLEIRTLSEANNSLLQAGNIAARQNFDRTTLTRWQNGNINSNLALSNELQTRNNITSAQRQLQEIISRANQINADIKKHHAAVHIPKAIETIEALNTAYIAEENLSAQRYYTIAQRSLSYVIPDRKTSLEKSRNLLNGERRTISEGIVVNYYYPTEALQELTTLTADLNRDLQTGNTGLSINVSERQGVRQESSDNAETAKLKAGLQETVNELSDLYAQCTALADSARSRSSQAQALMADGERLLSEARTAFQRQNFDTARERIEAADRRFNESLAIQESASLRQIRDTQLVGLGQAIAVSENEAILAEVRNLVNEARSFYFVGNFQQAETRLVRAGTRWRITNNEPNEEVVYWQSLVRTALQGTSARVIPPTAPLYPEMSQLLNQAKINYEEGIRLVNAGQRTQGIAKFDETKRLTMEVKLMFPINQEAGMIDLRIEQFLDPRAFNASFEQRLRNAIARTRQRSLEAYAELQNLAEINPAYPGMRAIITQAEIDIGIRPPPPNPADLARSTELTAAARRILDSNQTEQFNVAIRQLDEAIRLNPQNMEAPRVRDMINSRGNQPSSNVLSSADEATYQQAMRELQAGNNLVAFALVERLMGNPQNRAVPKLVALQQRISSLL
jgi:hypothetical protein